MLVLLQLVYFVCYFLPLVSTLPPLVTPFLSFQFLPFVTASLRLKSFISLRPSFRFAPLKIPFVTSFLLCRLLQSVWYLNSFVASLSFHSLLSSFHFISLLSFVTSFRSFQLSPFIRYFLPFVSALTSSSFLHFKAFISLRPSFRITSFKIPFVSIRYFFPVVSPLTVRLLLELFRCNSFLSFITFFLSFHLSPFIRYFLPLISTLSFHWLLPSVRFNSDMPFVTASLRFKSFMSSRLFFRFTSDANCSYPLVTSSFCVTSYSPFVTWTLSLQLFPLLPSFRFNSPPPFCSSFRFNSLLAFSFFKRRGIEQSGLAVAVQTATFGYLRPLPPATCGHPTFSGSHLRPNSPLSEQVAASGRRGPQGAVGASGRKWPQVAAGGCRSKWPQVAVSGRKWPQGAGSKCPQVAASALAARVHGSRLQPLEWSQVTVGFKEVSRASAWQPLATRVAAALCGHLRPLAPTAPAATCGQLRPLAPTAPFGPLRPLAATCSDSPLWPLAATCSYSPCSHLRPLEWLQVAASGCVFEIQLARFLQPQCGFSLIPSGPL